MDIGISIIVRTKNDPNVISCVKSFEQIESPSCELIIVDSSDNQTNFDTLSIKVQCLRKNVSRFEALKVGIQFSSFDKILIIDSDQIVSRELITQLAHIEHDMCIISEMSYNKNFIGEISDYHREFLYRHAKHYLSASLPVIPRLYAKDIIFKAISKLTDSEISSISQHEDSVIYFEALKISQDVVFCDIPILNIDPSFAEFAKKSFRYGLAQQRVLSSNIISKERKEFLRSIDRNRVIYSESEGFNFGILYDVLKAFFYISGISFTKLHGWST